MIALTLEGRDRHTGGGSSQRRDGWARPRIRSACGWV